jgi:hypothetical protein
MVVKNVFCVVIIKNPKSKNDYAKNGFIHFFKNIKNGFGCSSMKNMVVYHFLENGLHGKSHFLKKNCFFS